MKKKILILGSQGMAGHVMDKYLESLNKYKIVTMARSYIEPYPICCIDIEKKSSDLEGLIACSDIVINCIGLLIKSCKDRPDRAVYVNSYFPHWLEKQTEKPCPINGPTKIIHLSTDCVFNGKDNFPYWENDPPDAYSIYGRTKALGEIINDKDLTLRLSIIGPELKKNGSGLFEWVLRQEKAIQGYSQAFWSGITTLELAKQLDRIINTNLTGLYHLSPVHSNMTIDKEKGISKFELIRKIVTIWNKQDVALLRNVDMQSNKVLQNNRLDDYDPKIPSYDIQLKELKEFIDEGIIS